MSSILEEPTVEMMKNLQLQQYTDFIHPKLMIIFIPQIKLKPNTSKKLDIKMKACLDIFRILGFNKPDLYTDCSILIIMIIFTQQIPMN